MASLAASDPVLVAQQKLEKKATFEAACKSLAAIIRGQEQEGQQELYVKAATRAHTLCKTRYTSPGFWRAAAEVFEALKVRP